MDTSAYNLIVITGATASGKTSLAAHLAKEMNGEVISADSRQVFRGMDIGTGKDYEDYTVDGVEVPYHLIDIREPGEKYSAFDFQEDFERVYRDIINRGKTPILCGGTGMYIDAVTKGFGYTVVAPDKELRNELEYKTQEELLTILEDIDPNWELKERNHRRRTIRAIELAKYMKENPDNDVQKKVETDLKPIYFAIQFPREERRRRISKRLKDRLDGDAMLDEVKRLLEKVDPEVLISYGLEYKFITQYLQGEYATPKELYKKLQIAIHQFSKRQMTWFRKMERNGSVIQWIEGDWSMDEKIQFITDTLKDKNFQPS